MRRLIVAFSVAAVLLGAVFAGTVTAKSFTGVIVLPGATSAEGIARAPDRRSTRGKRSLATSSGATYARARCQSSSLRPLAGWHSA